MATVPNHPQRSSLKMLPDPEPLTDGNTPHIEDWLFDMRNKLSANADHFTTPALQIAYVANRIRDPARNLIRARLGRFHEKKFETAEQIFQLLQMSFIKPKKAKLLEADFRLQSMELDNDTTFLEFFREYYSLATGVGRDDRQILLGLRMKMRMFWDCMKRRGRETDQDNIILSNTMRNDGLPDLKTFVEYCGSREALLDRINKDREFLKKTGAFTSDTYCLLGELFVDDSVDEGVMGKGRI